MAAPSPPPLASPALRWGLGGALALLALLCHLGALQVPFVGDDTRIVIENASLQAPLRWGVILEYERFRPLTNLSYAFDAARTGAIEAPAFHWTNLVFHALFVALLFALALSRGLPWGGALLAGALVACHPLFV